MSYARNLARLARIGIPVFANAAAVRSMTIYGNLPPLTVETRGALVDGDEGGGTWDWDATSTDADTLGTVLQVASHTGPGRYKRRIHAATYFAAWFGMRWSRNIDDGPTIQACHDVLEDTGGVIDLGGREIGLGTQVEITKQGVTLRYHSRVSRNSPPDPNEAAIYVMPSLTSSDSMFKVYDPAFSHSSKMGTAVAGFFAEGLHLKDLDLDTAHQRPIKAALDLESVDRFTVHDCNIDGINGAGILIGRAVRWRVNNVVFTRTGCRSTNPNKFSAFHTQKIGPETTAQAGSIVGVTNEQFYGHPKGEAKDGTELGDMIHDYGSPGYYFDSSTDSLSISGLMGEAWKQDDNKGTPEPNWTTDRASGPIVTSNGLRIKFVNCNINQVGDRRAVNAPENGIPNPRICFRTEVARQSAVQRLHLYHLR